MTKYVALLRGIMPMNPNMKMEKIRGVFEKLGFHHVQSVIASGNILFESHITDQKQLETMIETALPEHLGFTSTTIVRRREQLQKMLEKNPFHGIEDTPHSRLQVTFLKNNPQPTIPFPYQSEDGSYQILGLQDNALFSILNPTITKTPDVMLWLEKQFGKQITTRTWKTVHKILTKLND
ncbi:MAG: DUF1697 domain-containing protein [Candidatus Roizmanbacteria bacterium]|nr:DUF1697 domain-containing protein [Candidatus Roizmanbacteria bacterium]